MTADKNIQKKPCFERYGFLMRDRRPSASSRLSLNGIDRRAGKIDFYSTPIGTLVCAEVRDLPCADKDGYDACFLRIDEKKSASGHKCGKTVGYRIRTASLPPVFLMRGSGSVSFMTDRFSVFDLVGRSVFLCQGGKNVACGEIVAGNSD